MLTNQYEYFNPCLTKALINAFEGLDIPSTKKREDLDLIAKRSINKREEILFPIVFENDYVYDNVKNLKEFVVSLGIFKLDTSSVTAAITKNNKLELSWIEREGSGKFTSLIPQYLIATSVPVLSYEGGVLDVRFGVKDRNEDEPLFVGKFS